MSPESLIDGTSSTKSDVWSYGVTIWELFTLANKPWVEVNTLEEILKKLLTGERLKKPKKSTEQMQVYILLSVKLLLNYAALY